MRYQRRISVNDNIKINVSKSGISPSVKVGNITVNPKRGITYNTPIKGLSLNSKKDSGLMAGLLIGAVAVGLFSLIAELCEELFGGIFVDKDTQLDNIVNKGVNNYENN